MVGPQRQAPDTQFDDGDNVLHSFKEWLKQDAQAKRNRKVSSGRKDTTRESSPYLSPSIASSRPSIVPDQRAIVEEIRGNKHSVGRGQSQAYKPRRRR